MKKKYFILILLLIPAILGTNADRIANIPAGINSTRLYYEMELENIVDYHAFEQAITGYNKITSRNKEIVTLIDYSKPSSAERLYVMDIKNKKLLFKAHVSHGRNSGGNYATSFSNQKGSFKSPLGFFLTEDTYRGKNGYSLVLKGLEKDINDNSKERAIVIHGASYSNPSVIASSGRLGRSLGCPALPENVSKQIIDTIKDGSLIFIFANDRVYNTQSRIF